MNFQRPFSIPVILFSAVMTVLLTEHGAAANLCSLDPESQVFFKTRRLGDTVEISICEFLPSEKAKLPLYRHVEAENCRKVMEFSSRELDQIAQHEDLIIIGEDLTKIVDYSTGYGLAPFEAEAFAARFTRKIVPELDRLLIEITHGTKISALWITNGIFWPSYIALYLERWENRIVRANEAAAFLRVLKRSLDRSKLTSESGCIKLDQSIDQMGGDLKLISGLIDLRHEAPKDSQSTKSIFDTKFTRDELEGDFKKVLEEYKRNMLPALPAR